MSAGRVKDVHLLVGAGVLTVLLGGAAALIAPSSGAVESLSSFSAAGGGGKAAFETLKALGYSIERSYEPMTAVAADPASTTLMITGSIAASEQDKRSLHSFLEAGGTAVLIGAQGAAFLEVADAVPALPFDQPARHRAVAPSPLSAGVREITMTTVRGAPRFGPSYVRVFAAGDESPLVVTARVGQGRAVWLAAPTPLSNAQLANADNLQLLLNVAGSAGERLLLWDEYYHGHSRALWSYASNTPLPWIGAQLGVVMAAVFATYSRRRGPVRAPVTDARTSPLEFIDMLRALYARAGAADAVVASARARLKRTVAATQGIPVDSPDETIAGRVSAKTGADHAEILHLLGGSARAAADPDLRPAEALRLVQELQRVTEKLHRGTQGNAGETQIGGVHA